MHQIFRALKSNLRIKLKKCMVLMKLPSDRRASNELSAFDILPALKDGDSYGAAR